jgi:translation initiation factor 1
MPGQIGNNPRMRPEKPKRVEVNPTQPGLAEFGNALAGLNLGGLPPGPAQPAPVSAPTTRSGKKGRVILRKETAHRGGKTVIVVHDFPPTTTPAELEMLARRIRQAIGTGGAVKDRTLEIQGDQASKIRAFLEADGWVVVGV